MKKKPTKNTDKLSATEIDALHESGGDMQPHWDVTQAIRSGRMTQRVNVDFPVEFLEKIDAEANRIGITRQSWIKAMLAEQLKRAG